ncbi:MAG: hypothetical protein QF464_06820, partial [Myxococcota bacterium]|nr:hypothetical protein [Myxococcota bacterium]
LDARVAVATTDMHCDPQNPQVNASMGQFSRFPATSFPPGCQKKVREVCSQDKDCENLDCEQYGQCGEDQGLWTCSEVNLAKCMENPNGSINTDCKRRCTTDEECQTLFSDERYICQKPSGNRSDWGGCILPPMTDGCPAVLPAYLTNDTLGLFPCQATVGVNQLKCYAYEQGLASAYAALDPSGPNHLTTGIACSDLLPCPEYCSSTEGDCPWEVAQAADSRLASIQHLECVDSLCRGPNYGFLRDDAYLVIVFVSDEEDCSAESPIGEDYHDQCGVLDLVDKGTEKGGPLVEVSHYVNLYKSLKSDPTRVLVAAITGDAVPPTPEEVAANIAPACSTCAVSGEACEVTWNVGLPCTDNTCGDTAFPCTPEPKESDPTNEEYDPDCEKNYLHTCDTMTCTDGTCGDTAVSCSSDEECNAANTCQSASGETLILAESNEQNPLCNCLSAPKSFDVMDYHDDDPQEAITKQVAFADQMTACQREQYLDSKSNPFDCHNTTYVCASGSGIADWGSRYYELTERFGAHGFFTNICDAEGIGPALEAIAQGLIARVHATLSAP